MTRRLLGAVVLLAAGAATSVAAVVTHHLWWGLPLTAAGLAAAQVAVGRGWLTRLPLAVGFAAGVGVAASTRAEGDFLIGGDVRGWLLLAVTFLVVVVAVATLPRPGRRVPQPGTGRSHT